MGKLVTLLLWLTATPVLGQDMTLYDRFRLWNDCQAMGVLVEDPGRDATEIGLTKSAIETAVRSRLRAARLYDDSLRPSSYLYVNINVVGPAFSIRVGYNQEMVSAGGWGVAPTWETGVTGTHGKDGSYILSDVSMKMDRFIDEYLRVNADAC